MGYADCKEGTYYSKKRDTILGFGRNSRGQMYVLYSQWCPAGTWSDKEGYYHGFGDSHLSEANFRLMWEEYEPEFICDLNWYQFCTQIVFHLGDTE